MVEEKGVLETVKETVEESKKRLEEALTAIDILEAMDIDTREVRRSYNLAKMKVDKMEKAYITVSKKK